MIGTRTKDKGCVQYDLLQSAKDPTQFRMIEAWATQADLDVHAGDTVSAASLQVLLYVACVRLLDCLVTDRHNACSRI